MSDQDKRVFARLDERNRVVELVVERERIEDEWHPSFLASCVEVTGHQTRPEVGWVRKGNGQFGPYEEPAAPPPVRARMKLAAGITVRGRHSGVYDAAGPRWQLMRDEAQHVATFGEFSTGEPTLTWRTRDGEVVEFESTDDFMKVVKVLSRQAARWQRFGAGDDDKEPAVEVDVE